MTLTHVSSPLVVAFGSVIVATRAHRRLPPHLSARLITSCLIIATAGALPTLLLVAVSYLAHVPVLGLGFEWCSKALGLHGSVPAWAGLPAVGLVVSGIWRSSRLARQYRSLRCNGDHGVQIIDSPRPYAITLPGAGGQIIVSTSLWSALDDLEREVVLAHEAAHSQHRHDRYLLVSEVSASLLPPLRHLSRRLSFALERWADEAAAQRCGDRGLVAATLGKVSLQTTPIVSPAFARLGVADRMTALLAPPLGRPARWHLIGLGALVVIAAGSAAVQIHHLDRLIAVLCLH